MYAPVDDHYYSCCCSYMPIIPNEEEYLNRHIPAPSPTRWIDEEQKETLWEEEQQQQSLNYVGNREGLFEEAGEAERDTTQWTAATKKPLE
uniref:Uncharacterized protein n=1 Tax=Ditylenchus dipsaci TaxID=166011 RepID=A0A915DSX3_9BILA